MTKKIKVFAPATIANLAVGFDQLGLAIDSIGDSIEIELIDKNVIEITCDNPSIPTEAEKNTAGQALIHFKKLTKYKKGFKVSIEKGIPLGSGLGGSAASAVGAVVAANKLLGKPLKIEELLECALEGEKISGAAHYDNIAPCLFGGITLVSENKVFKIENNIKDLNIFLIHPEIIIKTADARDILPEKVSLKEHVQQSGYMARTLLAFERGDKFLLKSSLKDILIEPKRQFLIKGFSIFKNACEESSLGFSISGSGPTMFCLYEKDKLELIEKYINKASIDLDFDFWTKAVNIRDKGAN